MTLVTGFIVDVMASESVAAAFRSEGREVLYRFPCSIRFLYGLGIIANVWFAAPKVRFAVGRLQPDASVLVAMAVFGALAIGRWFEAATLTFLFALSRTCQAWSLRLARQAVGAIIERLPTWASGRLKNIPSMAVLDPGTRKSVLLVKLGAEAPLDAMVVPSSAALNRRPDTGQRMSISREAVEAVFAGTTHGDRDFRSSPSSPAAARANVVGSSRRRAVSEEWVERFATRYTAVILLVAMLGLMIPPLLFGGSWIDWFYRSLVLLVIGSPGALVISTSVTFVAAVAGAAKNGVLVKSTFSLEAAARLRAVAFSRAGTLTRGEPELQEVVPLDDHTVEEILEWAVGMERQSDHPVATAIVRYGERARIRSIAVESVQVIQGQGVTACIQGKQYWVGSRRYVQERGLESPGIRARLDRMAAAGHSVVIVGNAQRVCGLIALCDSVRPEARSAIAALHRNGIEHVVMVTGADEVSAKAIGRLTGVDEVRAGLAPVAKGAAVEDLVGKYGSVAMVGDGHDDALAMAGATIGIGVGHERKYAANESADVLLMSDDLSKLHWLIGHSARALGTVLQNVGLSMLTKALLVALALNGTLSLGVAFLTDSAVSLFVIANSLKLLRIQSKS